MSDLEAWLERLGLGQHAQVLAENDVDLDVLPHLSDSDLKELGLSLGHRRKLLAALRDEAPVAETAAPAEPEQLDTAPNTAPGTEGDVDRRQLTVMFCDLVGSTELSQKLDPEELREVMRRYHDAVARTITAHQGHVAKLLGDGVMAYFGWPRAHEDQAEMAIRAALAAAVAVDGIEGAGEPLAARVGIATGQVVIGDMMGEAVRERGAVAGEAPNLAARLQGLAQPGEVVINDTTRRLIGGSFLLEGGGEHRLKGFAEPVVVWRVTGTARAESRFEAAHASGLAPFIGREHELGLLRERWALAKGGEGQVVLLSGEAGIGKSRMVQALRDAIGDERHFRLRYQCSPYHTNSAFYPIIRRLERAARLAPEDTPEDKLDKLEGLLKISAADIGTIVPLFAALLSLSGEARYSALKLSPQQQRDRTIEALIGQVVALSRLRPVLFVLEDAHWIDPTTEAFIDLTLARIPDVAVLMVITHRPTYTPPWTSHPHQTSVALNRLGAKQGAEIVQAVGGHMLDQAVIERIIARADGVPLYVEELTNSVLEAGRSVDDPIGEDQIPATLQASFVARLDRLDEAKEIAQIGAVIGREFSHDLLAAIADKPVAEVDVALDRLVKSELVFPVATSWGVTYAFKHALVQDAAYETLLKRRRQVLHARIAEVMEELFPSVAEQEPELLAHHLIAADLVAEAVPYLLKAGRRASERSANVEAIAHLRQGLKFSLDMPATEERDRLELEFHLSLGPPLMAIKGFAAVEVGEVYSRARVLSKRTHDHVSLFPVNYGLWLNTQQRGQLEAAKALAEESLAIAEAQSNTAYLLQGHHAIWTTQFSFSDLPSCHHHAKLGAELYDPEEHRSHAFLYGAHDPGVCALNHLAVTGWFLGRPEQASTAAQQGKALAERLDHPFSLVLSLCYAGWFYQYCRQPELVLELSAAAVSECDIHGIAPNYRASALILAGWATAATGSSKDGIDEMLNGIADWKAAGQGIRMSYFLALLAEAYRHDGQIEPGLAALAQALDQIDTSGEQKWRPEVLRLKGDLVMVRDADDWEEAESCYRHALESARNLQARSLELRTSTSLAKLWIDHDKLDEARGLLTPIYHWFREGFDLPDLKDAKAVLDELS